MLTTVLTYEYLRDWLANRIAGHLKLDVSDLDLRANFLMLGVDSLELVGIAGELAELLKIEIEADKLWEYDSIDKLAEFLSSELANQSVEISNVASSEPVPVAREIVTNPYLTNAATRSVVKTMQPNGDRIPLFVGQGINAEFSCYSQFIKGMPANQPIYGLLYPEAGNLSIEQRAGGIIDGIRSIQRTGPYRLCGYCFGAILVYEIARQLRSSHQEVDLLVMIDPPYPKRAQKLVKRSFSESLRIRGLGISKTFCFLTEEAFTHPKNFLDRFYRQFSLVMSRTRRVLGLNSNSEADAMTHVFFRNNSEVRETLEITRNYKPLPLDTRVVIIQSSEFDVTHAYDLFCWEKAIQAECDCYVIPGQHHEIMRSEQVTQILQIMNCDNPGPPDISG
jgi:thioesterase domain-containing protein/acyl carrier protein